MKLVEPILTKHELLKAAGITSTTFNNWRIRGLIPLVELGCEKESLTRHKYSFLVAAYCAALTYYKGRSRKKFTAVLKQTFTDFAKFGTYDQDGVIIVSAHGVRGDCGYFENTGLALSYAKSDDLHVNIGSIIRRAEEMLSAKRQEEQEQFFNTRKYLL